MRIVSSASLFLAVTLLPCAHAHDSAPGQVGIPRAQPATSSRIRLDVQSASGTRHRVWVGRDATVQARARPDKIEVVGEIKDRAIIFIDSYPSIRGGMSYCQAGHERFLRIASIARKPAVETFHVKVESCRDNIELASTGIEWLPESNVLRVNWLLGPTAPGSPESRTIHVGTDGKPD